MRSSGLFITCDLKTPSQESRGTIRICTDRPRILANAAAISFGVARCGPSNSTTRWSTVLATRPLSFAASCCCPLATVPAMGNPKKESRRCGGFVPEQNVRRFLRDCDDVRHWCYHERPTASPTPSTTPVLRLEQLRKSDRHTDLGRVIGRSRLHHGHPNIRILAEARREHATSRTGANYDVIKFSSAACLAWVHTLFSSIIGLFIRLASPAGASP
jgi:hypothetical protein